MKTIRFLLAMLVFSVSSFSTPQIDRSEQFLPIFHAIKNPQNSWSLRPLLKNFSTINNEELTGLLANLSWEEQFERNGASIFSTNDLTTLEKFWAWALVLTVEHKLSLENFAALLDTQTFGKIPDRVITNGLQIIVGECPVFNVLAERKLISTEAFNEHSYLLPLRCEIYDRETKLSHSPTLENNEFSPALNDYQLVTLWRTDKTKFPTNVDGVPLIFWALERYQKNGTLSLFALIYEENTFSRTTHNNDTIWEVMLKSVAPELASYILQHPLPHPYGYLVLLNPSIMERKSDLSIPVNENLWRAYFNDHEASLKTALENAKRNLSINLINLIKTESFSWRTLLERAPATLYTDLGVQLTHPLEVALKKDPNIFYFLVTTYHMKVSTGLLAEKLLDISFQNGGENVVLVAEKIAASVLQEMSMSMRNKLRKACPSINF